MIHVAHTAHQGQKKIFVRNVDTDLVVLSVATVLPTTSANVPIPAHSIVSYLGPEQSRALPMMHALNWHEEINMGILKSCPTCNQCICCFDGLHIYRCSGCKMKVHMTQLNMFSNHRYVLRQCLHKGPLICTSHSRCTTIIYYPKKDHVSNIWRSPREHALLVFLHHYTSLSGSW